MNAVISLKTGDIFYHINLQHSGIPYVDFASQKYTAVEIDHPGINCGHQQVDPVLNLQNLVYVRLLDIKLSIPTRQLIGKRYYKIDSNIHPFFILENTLGLYESICDKYCSVRHLTPQEILNMTCFIRKFKIIKFA